MSLWLNDDEITELTGYKLREPRCKALAELGVSFKRRPADGFPLVERAQFDGSQKPQRKKEPNWAAA